MRFLDLTLPTLEANLACEEALLLAAEGGEGDEILRVWEWQRTAVVLGAAGRLTSEVHVEACRAARIPVVRRSSGGGAVLLGSGCLIYSLVLAYRRCPLLDEIHSAFDWVLQQTCASLRKTIDGIRIAGVSDLVYGDRKFSGNSQQRKREFLLLHGTILYGADIDAMDRFLPMPPRQPGYRRRRPHAEFVTNVPLSRQQIVTAVRDAWNADTVTDVFPERLVDRLVAEKYSNPQWLQRRL